jgi:hypothetical protein
MLGPGNLDLLEFPRFSGWKDLLGSLRFRGESSAGISKI